MSSLTYEHLKRAMNLLPAMSTSLEMISSLQAVKLDGTRPEKIKRTWKERLFSLPWKPWITTKIIQVPNYKPAIYKIGSKIVYHPSLEAGIRQSIKQYNESK